MSSGAWVGSKRLRTCSTNGRDTTLSGGEPCPAKMVALWRSGRLTDTVITVEGRTFDANKNVLAGGSDYFERHYEHGQLRDADHPKLLEHVTAAAFEPLLAFLYEGACTFDESLLAPVLRAAHYLGVAPLERAAVDALTERLSPSNALTAWTWGEELELPELATLAKETALGGFDEVEKIEEATLAQVRALVADDRLTTDNEETVYRAVVRWAESNQPTDAELFSLLCGVRFDFLRKTFMRETVQSSLCELMTAGQTVYDFFSSSHVSGYLVYEEKYKKQFYIERAKNTGCIFQPEVAWHQLSSERRARWDAKAAKKNQAAFEAI